MKRFSIWSTALVFSGFGVGCNQVHPRVTPPPQAQAPTEPAPQAVAPAPVVTPPVAPAPAAQAPAPTPVFVPPHMQLQPPPQKKIVRKSPPRVKKKIILDYTVHPNPDASPIGRLSAGDSAGSAVLRQKTVQLIASTESRLKTVSSRVASNKHDTITQIHGFLAQARKALDINDLQGAQTLATKAKILVDEMLR